MKRLFIFLFAVVLFTTSCVSKVNPNEWVVSTATCWNTMSVTKAGDIPPRLVTSCDRMVVLPATFMQMEFVTESKFKGRVAGVVKFSGQWRIADPILFLQNAKSLTSTSTGEDHKVDPNVLEEVENAVVDKFFSDIIREYTPDKEAGIDELTVEKEFMELVHGKLVLRGIEFASPSINITFSTQTEEALDVISALKFYEQNGELELGREVIKAKAAASVITTVVNPAKPD